MRMKTSVSTRQSGYISKSSSFDVEITEAWFCYCGLYRSSQKLIVHFFCTYVYKGVEGTNYLLSCLLRKQFLAVYILGGKLCNSGT